MSTATRTKPSKLTPYEAEQVRRIAAWKSHPSESTDRVVETDLDAGGPCRREAHPRRHRQLGDRESLRRLGVDRRSGGHQAPAPVSGTSASSRHKPLEECDALADRVERSSQSIAAVEGAATGAGGVLTTLLDIPLLFVLSLGTIRKIGHCYGYPLDRHNDRPFVLGVLIAAMAGSLEIAPNAARPASRDRGHAHRGVPGGPRHRGATVAPLSARDLRGHPGGRHPLGCRVELGVHAAGRRDGPAWSSRSAGCRTTARSSEIAPAEVHPLHLAGGWSGALNRVAYSGCYYLGFGVTLPVYAVASLLRPMDNAAGPRPPRRRRRGRPSGRRRPPRGPAARRRRRSTARRRDAGPGVELTDRRRGKDGGRPMARGLPRRIRRVALAKVDRRGARRRRDSGGEHHAVEGGDGLRRGLEVAGPVAFRDQERRPPVLVLAVPDLDPGPLVGEELQRPSGSSCRPRHASRSRRYRRRRSRRCRAPAASLTASIASSSVPASSVGARHPTPAAAIRGVQCWAFGSRGSAPSSDERLHERDVGRHGRPGGTASRRPGRGRPAPTRPA